jgi:hypothetical protein
MQLVSVGWVVYSGYINNANGENEMHTQDQGNNEIIARGMKKTAQGYLAMTFSESKWFQTEGGAVRWLAKRGFNSDGSRI